MLHEDKYIHMYEDMHIKYRRAAAEEVAGEEGGRREGGRGGREMKLTKQFPLQCSEGHTTFQ